MPFPTSYQGAVAAIATGQHIQPVAPIPMPLGINVPCRRVLLYTDAGDTVYVCSQREAGAPAVAVAAVGFLIPQAQADGNVTPLEFWVNNVSVIWICGANGGETVYWVAEQDLGPE